MDRRDFIKLSGSAVAAGALAARQGSRVEAQAGAAVFPLTAPPIEMVRIGYVGIGGQGSGHVSNLLKIPGCRITAVCDIRPERTDVGDQGDHRRGPSAADRLHARPARLRADVRDRSARSRLQRDAVGIPRADHAGRDEERKAHRDRSAGGDVGRGLLGDGRGGREAPEALRADGELQLRPHGDDGLQHGPPGRVRRDPPRRGRLPARSAIDQVRRRGAKACGAARGRRS